MIIEPHISDWIDDDKSNHLKNSLSNIVPFSYGTPLFDYILKSWLKYMVFKEAIEDSCFCVDIENLFENAKLKLNKQEYNKVLEQYATYDIAKYRLTRAKVFRKWCDFHWGKNLESLFYEYKKDFDLVSCNLIRVKNEGLANEIYYRLLAQEESFEDLAILYGQGKEAQQGGLIESQSLNALPSGVEALLVGMNKNEILRPHQIGSMHCIIRMNELKMASFSADLKNQLFDKHFDSWVDAALPLLRSIIENKALTN